MLYALVATPALLWLAAAHGAGVQAWLVGVNVLAVLLYARDKTAAQAGRLRTPEIALHALALAGAVPAAAWARQAFHHKTRKVSFDLVLTAATCLAWGMALRAA